MPKAAENKATAAAIGLSSFAFDFFPAGSRRDLAQRGRYVGGWGMRVRTVDFQAGIQSIGHSGAIWLPRTVRTDLILELRRRWCRTQLLRPHLLAREKSESRSPWPDSLRLPHR